MLRKLGLGRAPKRLPTKVRCGVEALYGIPGGGDIYIFDASIARSGEEALKIHFSFHENGDGKVWVGNSDIKGYSLAVCEGEYDYMAGLIIKPEDKWEFIRLTRNMNELMRMGISGDDPYPVSLFIEIEFEEPPIERSSFILQNISNYRLIPIFDAYSFEPSQLN